MEPECPNMIIGSYTEGKEKPGLYYLDSKEHTATSIQACTNPSFAISLDDYLYVVEEHESGLILTLNSKRELISRVSTMGDDPCHISSDRTGKYLVVTNYSSGSIFICELVDHKPAKIQTFITLEGKSNHPQRQTSPHPHSSVFSYDNKILFVADLGTDIVFWYDFSEGGANFDKAKSLKMPDTGPRTLAIGPADRKSLYLSCELDNSIRVLSYANGQLELMSAYKISANPNNFLSEIVYLNGAVYVGLRGDNKVMIFDQEKENPLKLVQRLSFNVGDYPRHFAVSSNGYLVVACQKESKVMKFLFQDGKIYHLSELNIVTPAVVLFVK